MPALVRLQTKSPYHVLVGKLVILIFTIAISACSSSGGDNAIQQMEQQQTEVFQRSSLINGFILTRLEGYDELDELSSSIIIDYDNDNRTWAWTNFEADGLVHHRDVDNYDESGRITRVERFIGSGALDRVAEYVHEADNLLKRTLTDGDEVDTYEFFYSSDNALIRREVTFGGGKSKDTLEHVNDESGRVISVSVFRTMNVVMEEYETIEYRYNDCV